MPADQDKSSSATAEPYQSQEKKNFQWKSPLLSAATLLLPAGTADAPSADEIMDWESPQSVKVPEAGWYGLCFAKDTKGATTNSDSEDDDDSDSQNTGAIEGSDEERNIRRAKKAGRDPPRTQHPIATTKASKSILKKKKYNRKNRPSNWNDGQPPQNYGDTHTENTDPQDDTDSYTYYLALQWPKESETATPTPVTMSEQQQQQQQQTRTVIPLEPQPMREIVLSETAVDVGWLHYFPEGCWVGLARQQKTGVTEMENDDTLQWSLVYRRWVSKAISSSASTPCSHKKSLAGPDNPSSNNNSSSPSTPPPGTVATVKKAIVCAQCSKRFASPRAAIGHRDQVHAIPENVPIIEGATRTSQRVQLPDCLDVLYQDNFVAAIDKPQGVAVMGDKTTLYRSDLFMQLAVPPEQRELCVLLDGKEPQQQQQQQQPDDKVDTVNKQQTTPKYKYKYKNKPVPVHRLDAATGGILMIAKTKEAEASLKMSFHDRKCHKKYRALLIGRLEPPASSLEDGAWVEEDVSGKPSRTRYCVVAHHPCVYTKDGWVTVVNLFPETGRKHQLRKHMKVLGHSIWGDRRYGGQIQSDRAASTIATTTTTTTGEKQDGASSGASKETDAVDKLSQLMSRLCLWAVELTFPHPDTNKEMSVKLKDESPEWLQHVIREVAKQEKL